MGAVAWGFSTCLLFWDGFAIGPTISTFPCSSESAPSGTAAGSGFRRPRGHRTASGIAGGHAESFFHCLAGSGLLRLGDREPAAALPSARSARRSSRGFSRCCRAPLLLPLLDALLTHGHLPALRAAGPPSGKQRGQSVSAPESAAAPPASGPPVRARDLRAESGPRLAPGRLGHAAGLFGRALLFPLALARLPFTREDSRRGRVLFWSFYLAGLAYGRALHSSPTSPPPFPGSTSR